MTRARGRRLVLLLALPLLAAGWLGAAAGDAARGAATRHVLLGTAFREGVVRGDPAYRRQLLSHGYEVLTPEFEFYLDQDEERQGRFDFRLPDAQVSFARRHGLALRGHVLVWGRELPRWLTSPAVPWTRTTLLAVMDRWIGAMVGRYAGRIHAWDVVNEPL